VSQETQKNEVRPFEADGIQEYDNQLPEWWLWLFFVSSLIGIAYGAYLHVSGGETLIQAYNQTQTEMAEQQAELEKVAAESNAGEAGGEGGTDISAMVGNEDAIAAGKVVYDTYCLPCHAADGGGSIGPNLTDNYWLHGNTPEAVLKTIAEGVPEKGMVAWKPVVGMKKVAQVTAFILTLQGTTPANPKAPQGELIE